MSDFKRYKLNPETLLYEIEKVSPRARFIKLALLMCFSIALSFVYFWLATSVFGIVLPKTAVLKMANARWASRIELMNRQLDACEAILDGLGVSDDEIYRNIFGMNPIPAEVRNAGFGGVNRYDYLDMLPENSILKKTAVRLDILTKKTYVQSRSLDEVLAMSNKAGDMASCIPAVPPIAPEEVTYRLSSSFGYRSDPITRVSKMHTGFDFACKPGNPVYATGDGVVESVTFEFFGYGNSVVIDHGFGYKTRYAHLKTVFVGEGMKVRRGERIAETGNSGRSTGPHLHYEVIYRGRYVNPYNYFDMGMPLDEYRSMVAKSSAESENITEENFRETLKRGTSR